MSENPDSPQLISGIHPVEAMLKRDHGRIARLLVQEDKHNSRIKHLLRLANKYGTAVEQLTEAQLSQKVDGNHQGVVAECDPRRALAEEDLESLLAEVENPLILVLDGITDPHNFGACLRSADAAGVDAVVVPKDNSAPLTAVVSKVASGAAEVLPVIRVTNLARTLRALKDMGLWITGTSDAAELTLYDADLTGPRVIVLGSEGKGMRRLTGEHCDELVSIPMAGSVSSLNVSVAAGVCLFEALRQRR